MENFGRTVSQLPPGFRFHPTDQELIIHYLRKKVTSSSSLSTVTSIIADVDLYKYNPWELPEKALFGEGEGEWFFFSPRDRKYPNGARPNRAAACGYWKATGTDKPILASGGSNCLGVKKALVFYKGRPPKGIKTDWVMHEYRLIDAAHSSSSLPQKHKGGSMRLDDWVLCRVRKKGCILPTESDEKHESSSSSSSRGYDQQPPAIQISEKAQPSAAALAGDRNLYEWSDNQLLAYLLNSSQQDQGRESSSSSSISMENSDDSTNSSNDADNNNIAAMMSSLQAYNAAAGYVQQPEQLVSSMLDSIKRKLSFGALDELIMSQQPPAKRLHFSISTDQLSPTTSFSVHQDFTIS